MYINSDSKARAASTRPAEVLIIFFYLILNVVAFFSMHATGMYVGDAIGVHVGSSTLEQINILGLVFLTYFLVYVLYVTLSSNSIELSNNALCVLEWLLFLGTTMGWIGFLLYDYGKAEHQSSLSFGFLFRLIPYSVFWIIYVAVVPRFTPRGIFLILYFVILKVAMGWTGMFVALFWVLFIRIYSLKRRSFSFFVMTIFVLLALFFIAPLIYAVKFYIRYQGEFVFDYVMLLSKIVSRMSVYPNALYCYEFRLQFNYEYSKHLFDGFYFLEPIVAVMPRSLLGLGGENLETIFVNLAAGDFNKGVIFYLGLLGKLLVYWEIGFQDFGNVLILFFVLIFSVFLLLNSTFRSWAKPCIFYFLMQLVISGSFEELAYTIYGVAFLYIISKVRFSFGGRHEGGARCVSTGA